MASLIILSVPPDAEELCVVNNCFDIYLTFLIIEYCKQIYYYKCNGKNSETGRTFFCKQGVVLQYRLIKASKNSRSLNNNGAAQIQLSRS